MNAMKMNTTGAQLGLWALLLVPLFGILEGCDTIGGAGGYPIIGINGSGFIPVVTDIIATHPSCRMEKGYWAATECQRGYNEGISEQSREYNRMLNEQADQWYRLAYEGTRWSPEDAQITTSVNCAGAPTPWARNRCYKGLQDGQDRALSDMRSYRRQVERNAYERGRGVSYGTLQ